MRRVDGVSNRNPNQSSNLVFSYSHGGLWCLFMRCTHGFSLTCSPSCSKIRVASDPVSLCYDPSFSMWWKSQEMGSLGFPFALLFSFWVFPAYLLPITDFYMILALQSDSLPCLWFRVCYIWCIYIYTHTHNLNCFAFVISDCTYIYTQFELSMISSVWYRSFCGSELML